MISIIITTYKEQKTLPKALQTILDDIRNSGEFVIDRETFEVLVVAPDEETEKIVQEFSYYPVLNDRIKQAISIKYLKDKGIGKPAALNLAFKEARGEILILTDGDVWLEKGAIKKLLKHFGNPRIGAVSGHPVSVNSRKNIFGYWSQFLTDAADFVRRKKTRAGEYLVCSGYLYAIRNVVKEIVPDTLVEDSIISQMIWQQGYKIAYEPEVKVYVKYPDNFSDWLKQKIRATGGYVQKSQIPSTKSQPIRQAQGWPEQVEGQINSKFSAQGGPPPEADAPWEQASVWQIPNSKFKIQRMRGFIEEAKDGIKLFFTYPKNIKEFYWTILLYLARLYLWLLIFWRIKILKKTAWPRVESTK